MRICSKCLVEKELTEYYKDPRGKYGTTAKCKACYLAYKKDNPDIYKRSYERTKIDKNRRRRLHYSMSGELQRKARDYGNTYYQLHKEQIKARVKVYSAVHAEKLRQYHKEYRQQEGYTADLRERSRKYRSNPDHKKILALRQTTYARRKYNNPGYTTKQQLAWRWEYYGYNCYICSKPATETDHVIPVSKGGSNWPANLRPICKVCNVRKGNKPYILSLQTT